jgi:hypothetical protein
MFEGGTLLEGNELPLIGGASKELPLMLGALDGNELPFGNSGRGWVI